MLVYRIVKNSKRTHDLSGTGAFKAGGRWNSMGTYMLYTSETSSLAYLETLAHTDDSEWPPHLYIMQIEIDDQALIYTLPETNYPAKWLELENQQNKLLGDKLMRDNKYLAIRVKSAINVIEYNVLLNPLHPDFNKMVTVADVYKLNPDERLVR